MSQVLCPCCASNQVAINRDPDGTNLCAKCLFKWKPENDLDQTIKLERARSPEEAWVAEILIRFGLFKFDQETEGAIVEIALKVTEGLNFIEHFKNECRSLIDKIAIREALIDKIAMELSYHTFAGLDAALERIHTFKTKK